MTNLSNTADLAADLAHDTRAFPRAVQAKFLTVLADWGNVRAAAKAVGVARATAYRMRRQCLTFRELWDAALLHARPMVEEVLADRALNGVQESVFYHGEEVATRTRYDSRLLLAHLARLDKLAEARAAAKAEARDAAADAAGRCECGSVAERPDQTYEEAQGSAREEAPSSENKERDQNPEHCATPPLEARLQAMEAARPKDAEPIAHAMDSSEAEMLQLRGFEHGAARWWEFETLADMPPELLSPAEREVLQRSAEF